MANLHILLTNPLACCPQVLASPCSLSPLGHQHLPQYFLLDPMFSLHSQWGLPIMLACTLELYHPRTWLGVYTTLIMNHRQHTQSKTLLEENCFWQKSNVHSPLSGSSTSQLFFVSVFFYYYFRLSNSI